MIMILFVWEKSLVIKHGNVSGPLIPDPPTCFTFYKKRKLEVKRHTH